MAYDRHQFRKFIEDVLAEMARLMNEPAINSPAAVNLLLGTAAQESKGGTCLEEYGGGPGLGAFQITHKATFYAICSKYKKDLPHLAGAFFSQCKWDLKLSVMLARLWYWEDPDPLPAADDIEGMGVYWNDKYNRNPEAGTPEEFVGNYHRYVA